MFHVWREWTLYANACPPRQQSKSNAGDPEEKHRLVTWHHACKFTNNHVN